jgi:hypothetical protein
MLGVPDCQQPSLLCTSHIAHTTGNLGAGLQTPIFTLRRWAKLGSNSWRLLQVLPHNMRGRLSHWSPTLRVPQETPSYMHAPAAWESITCALSWCTRGASCSPGMHLAWQHVRGAAAVLRHDGVYLGLAICL